MNITFLNLKPVNINSDKKKISIKSFNDNCEFNKNSKKNYPVSFYGNSNDEFSNQDNEPVKSKFFGTTIQIYRKQVNDFPILSSDEENQLIEIAYKSNLSEKEKLEAKRRLIESNLRYAYKIALKYQNSGLPLEDIIQAGNIGLIKAVKTYNPEKSPKITNYASTCIDNEIKLHIRYQKKAHIRYTKETSVLREIINQYYQEFQRKPAFSELKAMTGWNSLKLSEIMKNFIPSVSLNQPVGCYSGDEGDENLNVIDTVADNRYAPEQGFDQTIVGDALETITEQEREIISLRYGFNGNKQHTQKEVGNILGISRASVSKKEIKALNKLRNTINRNN